MHSSLFLKSSELPRKKSPILLETSYENAARLSGAVQVPSWVLQAALPRQQTGECQLSQTLQSTLEIGWTLQFLFWIILFRFYFLLGHYLEQIDEKPLISNRYIDMYLKNYISIIPECLYELIKRQINM